jgi:TonB-linked SusC/RagA family outer membrane protein
MKEKLLEKLNLRADYRQSFTNNFIRNSFLIFIFSFFYFCSSSLYAGKTGIGNEKITITGTVTSKDGESLPGVNIVVQGTNTGAITDFDGKFTINVPDNNSILVFSFIGFKTVSIPVNGQKVVNVVMDEDFARIDEVVVTALGIKKEKKALGYAVTELQGDKLTEVRDASVINTLSGKVAGLNIMQTSTGVGGSSRIVIRGNSSLREANEPLIVVDGIPIDNRNLNSADRWGGLDTGSGISDINPDDIESVSVLKGPNAAALYGNRAANGVILITTKKGLKRKGIGISFNSNSVWETASILPDYQNEYGRGFQGQLLQQPNGTLYIPDNSTQSWGPQMEGQQVLDWNGETRPYSPQPNNIKDFWRTGSTLTNSLNITGGNDKSTGRISITDMKNKGIMPNSSLDKISIMIRATTQLTDNLSIDAKANYVKQDAFNRPYLSDSPDNVMYGFVYMPRSIVLDDLRLFRDANLKPILWDKTPGTRRQNPFWSVNLNTNEDIKDRYIGFVSATYKVTPWMSVMIRSGLDQYTSRNEQRTATNTSFERTPDGAKLMLTTTKVTEMNSDFLLTANKNVTSDFNLNGTIGGNLRTQELESIGYVGLGLNVANHFYIGNAISTIPSYNYSKKQVQSVYGSGQAAFKNYFYLDVTARWDWSTTLPLNQIPFFYPSASLSFILTDALNIKSKALTFAKVRASWAQVGNDSDPYRLTSEYFIGPGHAGQAYGMATTTAPLVNMKPEQTNSMEMGADIRLFDNRIGTDFSIYSSTTKNQILPIPISASSGFYNKMINAGNIKNSGFELMLRGVPLKTNNFNWEITFNFSKNTSEIKELAEGLDTYTLGGDRGITVVSRVGEAYGNMLGSKYLRNENGDVIIDAEGLPVRDDKLSVLGNYMPDWMGGIGNAFSYKNISLNFLIDIKQGGKIYSLSEIYAHENGNHKETLDGRADWYESERQRNEAGAAPSKWFPTGGLIAKGVVNTGTKENPVWEENLRPVDPQQYWARVCGGGGNSIAEEFIYDAGYIKLREISLAYSLPKKYLDKTPLTAINVSLVGRNLLYLKRGTDNIDPEANYNNKNAQGIENCSFPSTRSYGVNLTINF